LWNSADLMCWQKAARRAFRVVAIITGEKP
jgi:hypothetical protein